MRQSRIGKFYISLNTRRTLNRLLGKDGYGYPTKMSGSLELKSFKGSISFIRKPTTDKKADYVIYSSKKHGNLTLCKEGINAYFDKIPRRLYVKVEKEESN